MSTEQLKSIERQLMESSGDFDLELLYIMEVIDRREGESDDTDVSAAWERFNSTYLPAAKEITELYEDGADASEKNSETEYKAVPFREKKGNTNRVTKLLRRIVSAAAILAVVLAAGTVTARAAGVDIWSAIVSWTQDLFNVTSPDTAKVNDGYDIPEVLKPLADELANYGVSKQWVPKYLPEEYDDAVLSVTDDDWCYFVSCQLNSENDYIVLQYIIHRPNSMNHSFQKDLSDAETYRVGDTFFYIFTNNGGYNCAWSFNGNEGNIFNVNDIQTMHRLIDSIGG
jgi:hypothetical protein